METTVTTIDPITDPRWDKFVENHPFGWIVHLSGWKQLLEKSFPHMKGHYLALIDSSDNIRAAMPFFEVRSWLMGNRMVSIPLAQLSDPLISTNEDMEKIIEGALDLSKKRNTSYIEIRTLHSASLIQTKRLGCNQFYKHHYLTLDKDPEILKKSFHRTNVRQRIQRAIDSNVSIKIAESESELKDFHDLYMKTRKQLGLLYQPYRFLKSLWDIFAPSNKITLLLAKHEEQLISGLLFFQFNGRFSAESLAWDRSYSNMSPNHLLFWEGIKLAYKNGLKIFDFGRTSPHNDDLMTFKSRWGTKEVDMPQFYYPENMSTTFSKRETSTSYKLIQEVCKKSPESIYRILGLFCYRHLG